MTLGLSGYNARFIIVHTSHINDYPAFRYSIDDVLHTRSLQYALDRGIRVI